MPSIDLRDARVLVLGGSGVLGGAIAKSLGERKARLVLSGRHEDRLRQQALEVGGVVPTIVCDLTDPDGPQSVVEQTVQLLDGLDGVVNAAGAVAFGPVSELDDAVLFELVGSNFTGPMRALREAARHMEGGFIASISGMTAEMAVAGMAAYSAVKAALSFMTIAMARELRSQGIHVLDARPPHTETGLVNRALAGTAPKLPRGLDPRDVAATIVHAIEDGKRELAAADFKAA